MTDMREELRQALEADESSDLDVIIHQRRPEDFEALRRLLAGDAAADPSHWAGVIYALGRWGDPAVAGAIRDLLPRLDHDERITAIDALGRLGSREAVDGILGYAHDESLPVRKFVARALARINTPQARAGLSELERTDASDYIRSLAAGLERSSGGGPRPSR